MSVIRDLFASKKFNVALVATIVWLVSLAGFDADPELIGAVLSPLYVYVLGQGVADVGKRKPTVELAEGATLEEAAKLKGGAS